jgi:DNA polymerase-3 subunit gamma/tau
VDYVALLNQLLEALHQLSLQQVLGEASEEGVIEQAQRLELAQSLSVERVQLLYQIGLLAQQDMKLAPDVRIGFEMALLRMLAFKPQMAGVSDASASSESNVARPVVAPSAAAIKQTLRHTAEPARQMVSSASTAEGAPTAVPATNAAAKPTDFPGLMSRMQQRMSAAEPHTPAPSPPPSSAPAPSPATGVEVSAMAASRLEPEAQAATFRPTDEPVSVGRWPQEDVVPTQALNEIPPWQAVEPDAADQDNAHLAASASPSADDRFDPPARAEADETLEGEASLRQWQAFVQQMGADGMALALARNVMLCRANQQAWWLSVDPEQLAAKTEVAQQRLLQAARDCFGEQFRIHYVDYDGAFFTLNRQEEQALQQQQACAREAILADENVQALQQQWGMTLLEQTIRPLETT